MLKNTAVYSTKCTATARAKWLVLSNEHYCTLNSLSLFWLAKSVQLIFEIRACDVVTADYSIIMSRSRLRLITPTSTLIILDITKTSSNNCLLRVHCPRRNEFGREKTKFQVNHSQQTKDKFACRDLVTYVRSESTWIFRSVNFRNSQQRTCDQLAVVASLRMLRVYRKGAWL